MFRRRCFVLRLNSFSVDWIVKCRWVLSRELKVGSGCTRFRSSVRMIKATVLVCRCSALRVKKSQGSTSHFLNLHRSRSYIEISVRNCFIFRSLGRFFFVFVRKKLHWSVGGISVGVFLLLWEEARYTDRSVAARSVVFLFLWEEAKYTDRSVASRSVFFVVMRRS